MNSILLIWINKPHLFVAFGATLFLILFHYLSPWLANRLPNQGKAFISFGGGVAVAYVFLHMLPNLVEYNKPIGEFLLNNKWLTPFTELLIYIVSLCGFIVYYGCDVMAERYRVTRYGDKFVYALHLFMFCLYNFLITYTMALRAISSITATILFTLSMALHFVLTDRRFSRFYQHRFNHLGRFTLISALLLGWLCSVAFDPVNVLTVALMMAFLAGSILLNVFREEIPSTGLLNYSWFTLGNFIIAIVLLIQTWLVKINGVRLD